MPNSVQKSLVKPLEPSSCAAALDGPNTLMPGGGQIVGEPRHQRRLGPDHHEVDALVAAEPDDRGVVGRHRAATHSAISAMPALPGAQ